MTSNEIQELRDWAARKMGWYLQDEMVMILTGKSCSGYFDKTGLVMYQDDWQPDRPESGQIWMLVERMRELGWEMKLGYGNTIQGVLCWVRFTKESYSSYCHNNNPCLAILKAARATEEE